MRWAWGAAGWARRLLGPLFPAARRPIRPHCRSPGNPAVPQGGLPGAAAAILDDFSMTVVAHGAESIPAKRPLLLVSNHPGAYQLPSDRFRHPRPDLKILASDVPFTRALVNTGKHLIYAPEDTSGRMAALKGRRRAPAEPAGAVLSFPLGEVEPDPAIMSGAGDRFHEWSPSIEVMLRKAPKPAW